jgi:hypothetical protein
MPLSAYRSKRETVDFPGGSFEVRGISLPDVALLISLHEYAINQIVEIVQSKAEMFGSENETMVREAVTELVSSLIRESPILVANLIAICADEEDQMDAAGKLPITVQIDALTKISSLSFKDMASLKKLADDVMKLIRGMVPTANPRRQKK